MPDGSTKSEAKPEIEMFPISHETCTVLGSRPKNAESPLWAGLDFGRSCVLHAWYLDTPTPDIHLAVAWMHPDDRPQYEGDDDWWCTYRVRPRAEPGKRWKRRMVAEVDIVPDETCTPPWAIKVRYG